VVRPTDAVHGHVDSYRSGCLIGWAYNPKEPQQRVEIAVLHKGVRLCHVTADVFREDLQSAGHGDGKHGFRVALPLDIFVEPTIALHVTIDASGAELLGSPVAVQNHRAQLEPAVLDILGQAIASTAKAAEAEDELASLARWLIQQFDVVYQQQARLAASASARRDWFDRVIGENMTLSDLLRQSACATVDRYGALAFPVVSKPSVTVIIAAFNHFDVTYRCLQSLLAHRSKTSFDVVLVDDASTDETIFAALVLTGSIQLIRNPRNVGFLHSVAAGAFVARGEALMLLNNDTVVQDGWLDALTDTLQLDPSIGIVGSKLLFPDGRLQEAGGIIWRDGSGHNYGRNDDPADPRYCFMRDVDYVSGAALLVRRSVFEAVGGFSEEFAPGYYEDTDLCFKVRAAGQRVVVQPRSRITHYEGLSSGTDLDGRGMKRFQRINHRTFLLKWFDTLQRHGVGGETDPHRESERGVKKRLLFIDETVPTPDRDAGSNAAVDHMLAWQRLGFKVSFVGADNMAKISPYTDHLEGLGIEGYYAPFYWSVEEVFRRARTGFDVIYLHRFINMTKYLPMVRQRFPNALVIYSMADMHHLRLRREAEVKQDGAIRERADAVMREELAMVAAADTVIVHSSVEAQLLRESVPKANVHVVPWSEAPRPVTLPFAERSGLGFIGGFNHPPNVDAAVWLVEAIMPLVWAEEPDITCVLIGADMPAAITALERPNIRVLGHVPVLERVLGQLRLTVAPLRFGAGLKGKVLTSMAMGLPCVTTPCGVEGMGLPALFDAVIGKTATDLAAAIVAMHRNEGDNKAISRAGFAEIAERFARPKVDALLRLALHRVVPADGLGPPNPPALVAPTPPHVGRRRRV
jgi:GT2 family glycosyltransferase/glycosyltransferase involved in cell wall biosynthesis